MAAINTVYPPEVWARESVMVLQNSHVAANLVYRNFDSEVAEYGDVVNTRQPTLATATSFTNSVTTNVTFSAADATNIAIALDQHYYTALSITDRDQNTSIKNLVEEFIEPMAIPLAQNVDDTLLGASGGLTDHTAISEVAASSTLTLANFAAVRGRLRSQQCPFNGNGDVSIVLGVEHEEEALGITALVTADQSGVNPPAVRTGFIGQIFGMNVYADQGVPNGTSSASGQSVAFHRRAMTLLSRPMARPGSEFGIRSSVMEKDGVALRFMHSYLHGGFRQQVSLDHLWGFQILDANLATILTDNVRSA